MPGKLFRTVAALVFLLGSNFTLAQHHRSNSNSELDQYVERVSELSSRARANVYFANPQSIFRGVQVNFVNVGTGNLTFLRRDLVASGRIPLVFARVYDSSSKGSIDFGPGWTLSAAESITLVDGKAHLLTENGSTIDFVKADEASFVLERDYPSDYLDLRLVDSTALQAKLRTGFTKQFQLIANAFRLVRVTDPNGNEVKLSYSNGLLNKIENANHSITILRNAKGRILSAQDDQNRNVQFAYDAQGRLIEVDDLGGNAWTYSYSADGKLKAAKDPLQRLNFGVFFDDNARVRRLQLPSGIIQFNYDVATRSTTVLDRKSLLSRFFQNGEGITTRIVNPLGEETAIGLDDSRNVLSLSRNGSVIERMEFDQQHRITVRHSTLESGTVDRRYSYDPSTGQLAGIHVSNGPDESFGYDASGNLISAGLSDGPHKYGYSASGDLTSFSTPVTALSFSSDNDGLIAGLTEGKNASTTMKHKAGGELDSIVFSDGRSAKYEFQPSGLRANLTYKDKRRVEYTYDPAGNLTSTKIFDVKGKQTAGQVLTLDESYQLVQQTTFAGKIVKFAYDKNGNLTEIREGKSLTHFEYDSLNRLVSVITPDGQHLTHDYKSGERSLVEEYEHAKALILDRRDTNLTFGSPREIFSSRPLTGLLGAIRFSESLGTFQLPGSGEEIATPEQAIEQPLEKLHIIADGTLLQQRQDTFNRPFNPMFIPAEYATINCCPECIIRPTHCFDCDPTPPDPTSISSMDPDQEDLGSTSFQVTFTGTFSGSLPHITFDKSGITVTIQSHTAFGIAATFDITNATTGAYVVTVTDTGGSDTANLTLLPFIDSIQPAMGLVGSSVPVTISGKGFGTAPTITLGGGITASNVSGSDTQITATFNIPTTAGGVQTLTVTNQGFSTQGDTFFGQIPSHLGVVSDTGATQNFSCAALFGLNYNGIQRQILYNVLDQQSQSIQAQMTVSESFGAISNNCAGVPNTPNPTTGAITDSTGTFPGPDLLALCSSSCLPADASGNPTGSCTLKVNQTWTANNFTVRTNVLTYNCNDVTVGPQ